MSEKSQKSRKTAAKPAPPPKPSAGKSPSAKTKAAAAVAGAPATKPKAAKRPQPTTARDTAPPPPPKETLPPPAAAQLSGDQQRMLENLSTNLARAAMTAQGAIAEAALRNADRPAALSTDPFHIAPALTEVMGKLASQPDRLVRAQADLLSRYMDLWQSTARRMAGETPAPVASPAKGDKRFLDPDWSENPVFDVMKQSYLVTADWLNSLVGDVEGVDPMARRRVEFFMKLLTDAFSPTNFLASNPTALREIMVTGGESLVRGMKTSPPTSPAAAGSFRSARPTMNSSRSGRMSPPRLERWCFRTSCFSCYSSRRPPSRSTRSRC